MNRGYRQYRVRPCRVCGGMWCVPSCPEYRAEDDPATVGWCEQCGEAIYDETQRRCPRCKEVENDGDEQ